MGISWNGMGWDRKICPMDKLEYLYEDTRPTVVAAILNSAYLISANIVQAN